MDLFSPKTIEFLLAQHQARPRKRLGQNFLTDKKVLSKILNAAGLTHRDLVVEVGPGLGVLTKALSERVRKVVAVEKDPKMVEILKGTLRECKNAKIVEEDILEWDPKYQILNTKYKVVANLPYYIISPVIRKFLEAKHKPKLMVLMVQKEVAQRICAKPPHMSLLAVSVQFYAKPEIVSYVSKNSFWPQPKVDSAIIKIVPRHTPASQTHGRRFPMHSFFEIVKAGFKQPRKQLANNLALGLKLSRQRVETWLNQVGINPTQRAETLSLQDWANLSQSIP